MREKLGKIGESAYWLKGSPTQLEPYDSTNMVSTFLSPQGMRLAGLQGLFEFLLADFIL